MYRVIHPIGYQSTLRFLGLYRIANLPVINRIVHNRIRPNTGTGCRILLEAHMPKLIFRAAPDIRYSPNGFAQKSQIKQK